MSDKTWNNWKVGLYLGVYLLKIEETVNPQIFKIIYCATIFFFNIS